MPTSGADAATTKKTIPRIPSRPDLRVEAGVDAGVELAAEAGAELGVSVMGPRLLFELG